MTPKKSTSKAKLSDQYLKAARALQKYSSDRTGDHIPACAALDRICHHGCQRDRLKGLFAEYFKPKNASLCDYWFEECRPYWPGSMRPDKLLKNRDRRVMALLFMHEIAKDLETKQQEKQKREMERWRSGPPPHVGWWSASRVGSRNVWRWWGGENWSSPVSPSFGGQNLSKVVEAKCPRQSAVRWTYFWPENARVPRINPVTGEVTGGAA